jgi:arginase
MPSPPATRSRKRRAKKNRANKPVEATQIDGLPLLDFNNIRLDDGVKHKFLRGKSVGIIGCPFSGGQPKVGVDEGPLKLVEYGLLEQLTELGWDCEFDGHRDLSSFRPAHDPEIRKLKQPRYVAGVTEAVSKAVKSHIEKGQLALTLGGDHSLAMGTVAGTFAVHPDAVLIWIDAHADINTPETTASGNIHGCPVAFLMGLAGHVPGFEWLKPCVRPDRIVYIGLRDIDPPEKKILKAYGIKAFSMHEVDKYGIGKVMDMALDHVNPNRDRPIHLSFDVDALDPTVAPSTGESVAMTAWDGRLFVSHLKRRSESDEH